MVIGLRVEIALHVIFLVVPIVSACPAAWGIGNLHQTAVVEEESCPSAVGSMFPEAVELVDKVVGRFSFQDLINPALSFLVVRHTNDNNTLSFRRAL